MEKLVVKMLSISVVEIHIETDSFRTSFRIVEKTSLLMTTLRFQQISLGNSIKRLRCTIVLDINFKQQSRGGGLN
jgi:hypothetical protein